MIPDAIVHYAAIGIGAFVVSLCALWHFRNYRSTGGPFEKPLSDDWKPPKSIDGSGRWR